MIELRSRTRVEGMTAGFVERFLLDCDDARYRRWWPGVHLRCHAVEIKPGGVGSRIFMDERIGGRRLTLEGRVEEIVPERKMILRMARVVRLPVWLILEYENDAGGVTITHTIRAGFAGMGAVWDRLLRLFFSPGFARAMEMHVREEFQRLKDIFLPAE